MDKIESGEAVKTEDGYQFLTFVLGAEIFGIDVVSVREVIEYETVYRIPRAPDYIRGVINLRGDVVPVVDLSARFYKGRTIQLQKTTCIVVIEIRDRIDGSVMLMGIAVDAIRSVADIYESEIEAIPSFGTNIRSDFIRGVGKNNDEFIILLNINTVLDVNELSDFE